MEITRKPTRRDLLLVVTELQNIISEASMLHGNDRDPTGFERGQQKLDEAMRLCITARSFDPPTDA